MFLMSIEILCGFMTLFGTVMRPHGRFYRLTSLKLLNYTEPLISKHASSFSVHADLFLCLRVCTKPEKTLLNTEIEIWLPSSFSVIALKSRAVLSLGGLISLIMASLKDKNSLID